MPRKQFIKAASLFGSLQSQISQIDVGKQKSFIPDIITFCYDKKYLNFTGMGMQLRPFQQITLKMFYRGTTGNQNLVLTQQQIQLVKQFAVDSDLSSIKDNILSKYQSGQIFRQLVLVWGRRSGKDFYSSIIAAYQAMRLLQCQGGNPYSIYNLSGASKISILTIACAKQQAQTAFLEIRSRILNSQYFRDKLGQNGLQQQKIYLLTPQDRRRNAKLREDGHPAEKGSILIQVGHSNSDSLRGKSVFVMILDEVAMYKNTGGSSSGQQIYQAMTPSLATFTRQQKYFDITGIQKTRKVCDSKVVSISSPRGQSGIFYKLFAESIKVKTRLTCQLPTWVVNPMLTQQMLRADNSQMSEQQFMMEFGAQFSGAAGMNMFPRQAVQACFQTGYSQKDSGTSGNIYFAHLDPATSSHNYSLVILHRQRTYNKQTKQNQFKVVVDHIKFWQPLPGKAINTDQIDSYIIAMKKKFFLALVTYDSWNSDRSIQKLKKAGIPAKKTQFTMQYKMKIYDELYNLLTTGQLKIPPHGLLRGEMLNLQRRFTPKGYSVFFNPETDTPSDDIIDALAGAAYVSMGHQRQALPSSGLCQVAIGPSNQRQWKTMSGSLGYGTGAQVSARLQKMSGYYRNKNNSNNG